MINLNFKKLFLFTCVLAGFASQSEAACTQLTINVQNALIDLNTGNGLGYDITVSKNAGSCNYFIVIDNGSASTFSQRNISHGGDFWPIQFFKEVGRSNIIKSYTESSTTSDVIFGSMAGGGSNNTATVRYYPYIDTSLALPMGPYTGGFSFSIYEGDVNNKANAVLKKSQNVNYKYTMGSYVDLSLVDTGAPFNIMDVNQVLDFGTLVTNETMSFDIVLDYNQGYTLQMSAPNSNGSVNRLKNTLSNDYVDYGLQVNGVNKVLSTVYSTVDTGTLTAPVGGKRLPVVVTIGNVNGARAGTYTETVSVRVLSNN